MRYIVRNIYKTPRKSISVVLGIILIVFICCFGINIKYHHVSLLHEIREKTVVTVKATQKLLESERGKYIHNQHPIIISDVRAAGEYPEVSAYNFTYQSPNIFHSFEINLDADRLLAEKTSYEVEGSDYLEVIFMIGVRDISFVLDEEIEHIFPNDSQAAQAIISRNIAELHGLQAGDDLILSKEYPSLKILDICDVENMIYVPIGLLESIGKIDQNDETISVSCFDVEFQLKNPDDAQTFIRKVQQNGLFNQEWFYLEADDANYKIETSRMKMLSIIIDVLVIGVLIAGGIILVGITIFHIKNKQYDMQILRSLGIKRKKIIVVNLGEMFIYAVCGIFIGMFLAMVSCSILGYHFLLTSTMIMFSIGIIFLCLTTAYLVSMAMLHHEMRL